MTIALRAEANDEGGRVARVEFFQRNQKLGEDEQSVCVHVGGVEPGNYVLSAKVTMTWGRRDSTAVNVWVKGAAE